MTFSKVIVAGVFASSAVIGAANASSVGSFDTTHGFGLSSVMVNSFTAAGHTHGTIGTLTAPALAGFDMLVTGGLQFYDSDGAGPVEANGVSSAAEIAALSDWINDGGTFVITGEHGGFTSVYNTWLNPFGITLAGVGYNYNTGAILLSDPTDPYLTGAFAGGSFPVDNHGWYSVVPDGTHIIATSGGPEPDDEKFAIRVGVGAGQIIAIADTYFLGETSSYNYNARNFLVNAASLALGPGNGEPTDGGGGQGGDGGISPVPLPAALPLLGSAFFAMGLFGRRRKNIS